MDKCRNCGGYSIMYSGDEHDSYFCGDCGAEKEMYSLDDIYNLTKGSIYATTIIGHMEMVKCTCNENEKCVRCDIIDKMNVVIEEIGDVIYC